jgi:hypothetical protein
VNVTEMSKWLLAATKVWVNRNHYELCTNDIGGTNESKENTGKVFGEPI